MDTNTAAKFISSLTKSLQSLIHGCLDFEKDIELGGYIYLRVDNAQKVDYILNEKMQKNAVNSLTFFSNSFHAVPLEASPENHKSYSEILSGSRDQTQASSRDNFLGLQKQTNDLGVIRLSQNMATSKMKHFKSTDMQDHHVTSDTSVHLAANSEIPDLTSKRDGRQDSVSNNQANAHLSSPEEPPQSLADFQISFHSSGSAAAKLNQSQDCKSNSRASSLHQQHDQKAGLLPESADMEVVYIKAEEEDEVFSIPLHPPGSEPADNLTVRGKPPWLSMGFRQPYFFPYTRLARSQSWDRGMSQHPLRPPHASEEGSLTCKICGKSYRSRQGLIFHERVKHQNVYNVHCPVCGKGFQQTTHMYGHMATHTNVKNFQCPTCGTKYAHKTSLQQHLRSSHTCQLMATLHHQDKDTAGQSPPADNLVNSKIQMQTVPQDLCKLPSHGQVQNVVGNDECGTVQQRANRCSAETVNVSDKQQDRAQRQDKEDQEDTSAHPQYAESSGGGGVQNNKDGSLPMLSSCQLPSSVHLSDLLHQLPMPSGLQQSNDSHLSWVGNSFPQLTVTPETFQLPQTLTGPHSVAPGESFLHSQVAQRGVRPLAPTSVLNKYTRISCQLCGYVSFTAKAHARHTTIKHSKRGSFVCTECGKSFHTNLGLTQHMQSHGGRQFECEICGKRFLYKHHLPRHQQAVHGKVTSSSSSQQFVSQFL